MIFTGIAPNFISVDGGEGGTGAALVAFSNSMGMPMREGLIFVHDTLVGFWAMICQGQWRLVHTVVIARAMMLALYRPYSVIRIAVQLV
jgi:glutamate synthase domain-containing protein 2